MISASQAFQEAPFGPHFCQGARCGHLEAKGRAGSYVTGEEHEPSLVASEVNVPCQGPERSAWAAGYRAGYCWAAEGYPLPLAIRDCPLPGSASDGVGVQQGEV